MYASNVFASQSPPIGPDEYVITIKNAKKAEKAINMKHYLSSDTQEKLTEHVNKILDLEESGCNCDENSEKCKKCIKYTIQSRLNNRRKTC